MYTKKTIAMVLLVLLFIGGGVAGYYYFSQLLPKEKIPVDESAEGIPHLDGFFSVRVYYPSGNRLQLEERRHPRSNAHITIAEATVEEYLKGPAVETTSSLPRNVQLLGVYRGADKILYVNFSDELRRNFQGDALTEYLLLKGLYESLISNVEDIQDVKVLIEGKEVETLGGHLYLFYPLKDIISPESG